MNKQQVDTLITKWEQQEGFTFDENVKKILYCFIQPDKIQELFKNKKEKKKNDI